MNVTVITSPAEVAISSALAMTEQQLRNEVNFFRAEKLAEKMLAQQLITTDEFKKILKECRKIFLPFLSEII